MVVSLLDVSSGDAASLNTGLEVKSSQPVVRLYLKRIEGTSFALPIIAGTLVMQPGGA